MFDEFESDTVYWEAPSTGAHFSTTGVGYVTVAMAAGLISVGPVPVFVQLTGVDHGPLLLLASTARTRQV